MLSICSFCELYAINIASRRSPQHLRLQVITSLSIDNSVWLANRLLFDTLRKVLCVVLVYGIVLVYRQLMTS